MGVGLAAVIGVTVVLLSIVAGITAYQIVRHIRRYYPEHEHPHSHPHRHNLTDRERE